MSYEKVKEYFNSKGLGERVIVREHIGDTVEHAAQSIGCKPAQIAKTMSFIVNEKPILILTLSLVELEQYASPVEWVDVCKGWYMNG